MVAHVSRSFGLAKTILQGTVKGKRRGRQKKKWEGNIQWTKMDFAGSSRENRKQDKVERDCCEFICVAPIWDRIKIEKNSGEKKS